MADPPDSEPACLELEFPFDTGIVACEPVALGQAVAPMVGGVAGVSDSGRKYQATV